MPSKLRLNAETIRSLSAEEAKLPAGHGQGNLMIRVTGGTCRETCLGYSCHGNC